ncbi:MAG: DEAD/DEAH box helicase [archaeon]|nr:DEAD/DEAH box helicase [archaeon]
MNNKSSYFNRFSNFPTNPEKDPKGKSNPKGLSRDKSKNQNKPKSTLPTKVLNENIKMLNQKDPLPKPKEEEDPKENPMENKKQNSRNIDKNINLKKLAKLTRADPKNNSEPEEKRKPINIDEPQPHFKSNFEYKPKAAYLIDKKIKFKDTDTRNTAKSQNKTNENISGGRGNSGQKKKTQNPLGKIRTNRNLIKDAIADLQSDNRQMKEQAMSTSEPKNSKHKLDTSQPKQKKGAQPHLVKSYLNAKYIERNRVHPKKVRTQKLNERKKVENAKQQEIKNRISETMNFGGKGANGLDDSEDEDEKEEEERSRYITVNDDLDKVPVFSRAFYTKDNQQEEDDHTPNKKLITNRLTTALKSSLRKCVPLDTELKFLSKEFKYLLSDKKEQMDKLNEIKEEELQKKNEMLIDIEEDQMPIDDGNNLSPEEISNMENEILIKVLQENFSFNSFRPGQMEAIKHLLNNKKIMTVIPPGGGKSLIYELSSLVFDGLTIVISPYISSINTKLTSLNPILPAASLTSFTTGPQKAEIINAMKEKKIKLLFITPERFVFENFNEIDISLICIEDAHCCCPFTNGFRSSYISIMNLIKQKENCGLLLMVPFLNSTSTESFLVENFLIDHVIKTENIYSDKFYLSISKEDKKAEGLIKLLNSTRNTGLIIIYCNTVKKTDFICRFLNQSGFTATSYHSQKDEIQRQLIFSSFIKDKIKMLVCTPNFSNVVNMKDPKLIIVYEIPNSVENLVGELGKNFIRNGDIENAKETYCHIFLHDDDFFFQRKITYADNVDKIQILKFAENCFGKFAGKKEEIKGIGKRSLNDVNKDLQNEINFMEDKGDDDSQDADNTQMNQNNFPSNICINFNTISDLVDIKKNTQLLFLISLLKSRIPNLDISLNGIGPCQITLRFYKTTPEELSEKDPVIEAILKVCRTKQGCYTFNTLKVCDILNMNYLELLGYLYNLQNQKELSYETKEEGLFLTVNNFPRSFKDIIIFISKLVKNRLKINIAKLNSTYILLRKFAANSRDAFNSIFVNKNFPVKTMNAFPSYGNYLDAFKRELNNYFGHAQLSEDQCDILLAGNELERGVILPIYEVESQREISQVTKDIEDFISKDIVNFATWNTVEIVNVFFDIFIKNKSKNDMWAEMQKKYETYNYDFIFNITENALIKAKSELICKKEVTKKKMKEK